MGSLALNPARNAGTELMDVTEAYVKFMRQTDAEQANDLEFNGLGLGTVGLREGFKGLGLGECWVAVKELKLSYHNGYM